MPHIAIIGAGPAGLTAAWRLQSIDADVTVFEKSRGYGGRAATRSHGNLRYDFGANYIPHPPKRIRTLITQHLSTDRLATIPQPVWTFDANGTRTPGDPESNAKPRWTYAHGINTLGKVLAAAADARVHRSTRIQRLAYADATWTLYSTDDASFGPFDAVLLTPPAPQQVDILSASTVSGQATDHVNACVRALQQTPYNAQFAYVYGLSHRLERPEPFHALLNTDRQHPIAWLSIEDDKPGRVPRDQSIVCVQMSPSWTAPRVDDDPAQYTEAVHRQAAALLDNPLDGVAWTDAHRWRYAAPTTATDPEPLDAAHTVGLYFAGDFRVGKGRVARAMDTGWTQADRIAAQL